MPPRGSSSTASSLNVILLHDGRLRAGLQPRFGGVETRRIHSTVGVGATTSKSTMLTSLPRACSDAFQKREKANEDYTIRLREKEKLLELRKKLREQQAHLKQLEAHMYVKPTSRPRITGPFERGSVLKGDGGAIAWETVDADLILFRNLVTRSPRSRAASKTKQTLCHLKQTRGVVAMGRRRGQ